MIHILAELTGNTSAIEIGLASAGASIGVGAVGAGASQAVGRNPGAKGIILGVAFALAAIAEGMFFIVFALSK